MATSAVPLPALPSVQVRDMAGVMISKYLIRISLCCSIYLVISVAIERHSAVCNPLAYRSHSYHHGLNIDHEFS